VPSEVVGLDFSGPAIDAARVLAGELGLADRARFVQADVYDTLQTVPALHSFDMLFVTWGAITWLPDIKRWAEIVAAMLRPGGSFYLADGHPIAYVFDDATRSSDGMTNFTSDIDRAAAGYSPDRVDALVWAFSELLVEPMESEGIYEFYRREAEAAEQRRRPQPAKTVYAPGSMEWQAEQRRNRAELLPLSRRPERRTAPTSSPATGGPMVRIHLPPPESLRTIGSAGGG
jgi:SAM-dependent methyltransferase